MRHMMIFIILIVMVTLTISMLLNIGGRDELSSFELDQRSQKVSSCLSEFWSD